MLFPSARLSGWVALGRLLCNPASSTGKILGKRYLLQRRPKRRLWDNVEEHLVVFWCNTQKSRLTHSCCATRGSFVIGWLAFVPVPP